MIMEDTYPLRILAFSARYFLFANRPHTCRRSNFIILIIITMLRIHIMSIKDHKKYQGFQWRGIRMHYILKYFWYMQWVWYQTQNYDFKYVVFSEFKFIFSHQMLSKNTDVGQATLLVLLININALFVYNPCKTWTIISPCYG